LLQEEQTGVDVGSKTFVSEYVGEVVEDHLMEDVRWKKEDVFLFSEELSYLFFLSIFTFSNFLASMN